MLNLFYSLQKDRQQRERKGCLRPMEGSAVILEHLKMIEVRCDAVDERICRLTLFLCAFHIRKLTCYTPRASTFLSFTVTFICVKTSLRRHRGSRSSRLTLCLEPHPTTNNNIVFLSRATSHNQQQQQQHSLLSQTSWVGSHIPQPCAKFAIALAAGQIEQTIQPQPKDTHCGEPAKPPFLNGVLHKFCQK